MVLALDFCRQCQASFRDYYNFIILNKHNSQPLQTCLSLNPQHITWMIPRKNERYVLWRIAPHDGDQKVALLMTDEQLELPGGSDFPSMFAHQILQCVMECRPKAALREPALRVKRDNEPWAHVKNKQRCCRAPTPVQVTFLLWNSYAPQPGPWARSPYLLLPH